MPCFEGRESQACVHRRGSRCGRKQGIWPLNALESLANLQRRVIAVLAILFDHLIQSGVEKVRRRFLGVLGRCKWSAWPKKAS